MFEHTLFCLLSEAKIRFCFKTGVNKSIFCFKTGVKTIVFCSKVGVKAVSQGKRMYPLHFQDKTGVQNG